MQHREEIVASARLWVGTRWVHQGRSEHGLDCAGLVSVVLNGQGVIRYETADYPRRTLNNAFLEHFRKAGLRDTTLAKAESGDVLVFKDAGYACHCGFLVRGRPTTIVHAHAKRRRVVEEEFTLFWQQKLVAVFKIPGVSHGLSNPEI